MDHIAEINDVAVHDAVDLFEAQIELLVLDLLDPDHNTAVVQITTARYRAAERIWSLAKGLAPANEDAKAIRIAVAMLAKTYKRLIDTVEHRRALAGQSGVSERTGASAAKVRDHGTRWQIAFANWRNRLGDAARQLNVGKRCAEPVAGAAGSPQ